MSKSLAARLSFTLTSQPFKQIFKNYTKFYAFPFFSSLQEYLRKQKCHLLKRENLKLT